jgi:hypothetical protein
MAAQVQVWPAAGNHMTMLQKQHAVSLAALVEQIVSECDMPA